MEINKFFFDMIGSFFLLKLGKTSSGGVGEDRLKKFLAKSDVGWSNTWQDRNVLLRARNALRRAPIVLVPVLKKKYIYFACNWTMVVKKFILNIYNEIVDKFHQLQNHWHLSFSTYNLRHITTSDIAKFKGRRKLCNII